MSKDKVIIILDSDDEEEEKVVVERRNERKRRQPSPVYTTIIIDSDDEEDAKNKKLEKIIMNNVEKKPKSLQTAANINKLFQKDTRLTNLKKSNVKPRKPQLVPSIELSQIDGSFEETQSSTASTSENVFDENIFDEDIFDDDFSDIDFNFTINSQNSAPPTPTPARTAKKCQEPVPTNKKPQIPEEEDLEYYISFFNKKRKRRSVTNTPDAKSATHTKCPICYLLFPKAELEEHASGCEGKKSIGAAVLLEQRERAKKRKGVQDIGPTNYYLDGDIVSTTGAGFNNEVGDGLNWESAGQTRFG